MGIIPNRHFQKTLQMGSGYKEKKKQGKKEEKKRRGKERQAGGSTISVNCNF